MKGADVAMASIVQYNDWLEEEVRLAESVCTVGLFTPTLQCEVLLSLFSQVNL